MLKHSVTAFLTGVFLTSGGVTLAGEEGAMAEGKALCSTYKRFPESRQIKCSFGYQGKTHSEFFDIEADDDVGAPCFGEFFLAKQRETGGLCLTIVHRVRAAESGSGERVSVVATTRVVGDPVEGHCFTTVKTKASDSKDPVPAGVVCPHP